MASLNFPGNVGCNWVLDEGIHEGKDIWGRSVCCTGAGGKGEGRLQKVVAAELGIRLG